MQKHQKQLETPSSTLERLRHVIVGGGSLLLESLSDNELAAMQTLIESGEAEIISSACRPYVAAKVNRLVINH